MDRWRDAYNASRTSAQLKREGKVVSVQLTEQLAQEYRRFRSEHQGWVPLESLGSMGPSEDRGPGQAPIGPHYGS